MLKRLFGQFIRFIGISGLGWCIDFSLYLIFTSAFRWPVFLSNCLSSIPAVTLVFIVSTRRIFQNSPGKVPVQAKYVIYLAYQFVLLMLVSSLGQWLANFIAVKAAEFDIIVKLSKVIAKVLITPVTMVTNFFVMKVLTEKL